MADIHQETVNIERGDAIYRKKVIRRKGTVRQELVNRFIQLMWLVFIVLEGLIGLRVFLKLIAANPDNGFAVFVYDISHPFLVPFFGLTSTPSSEGMVLEIPSLIAMLVYLLVAVVIIKILWLILSPTESGVVSYSETIE